MSQEKDYFYKNPILLKQMLIEKKTLKQIANLAGVGASTIMHFIKKHNLLEVYTDNAHQAGRPILYKTEDEKKKARKRSINKQLSKYSNCSKILLFPITVEAKNEIIKQKGDISFTDFFMDAIKQLYNIDNLIDKKYINDNMRNRKKSVSTLSKTDLLVTNIDKIKNDLDDVDTTKKVIQLYLFPINSKAKIEIEKLKGDISFTDFFMNAIEKLYGIKNNISNVYKTKSSKALSEMQNNLI